MISYKKPDLKAPRFRQKRHTILNSTFYDKVRNEKEELKNLSDKEIKNIVKTFNINLWKTVIEKRDGVELLEQLGYLFIGTCKFSKNVVNVDESIKNGVRLRHQNWQSDQHLAKIFYTNFETKYGFKFHNLWGFEGFRDFKRSVSKEYSKEWKKYVVVDNLVRISRLFRRHIFKDVSLRKTNMLLETYDEFDMT